MSEKLYVKNPLFPMAGIAVSVFTFAFGLAIAKSPGVFFFLGGIWLLLALFGYLRPCLAVLPAAALLCGIFCALTYAISRDATQTSAAGDLFCPADVFTYGKAVTSCLIPFKTFLVISNLCRRNNPDAALCRHCTGKRASADTNSHTALDDWFLCCQFSYLEWL